MKKTDEPAEQDAMLIAACEAMNRIEAAHPKLLLETAEWLEADLVRSVDDWDPDFDAEKFLREVQAAQAALRPK